MSIRNAVVAVTAAAVLGFSAGVIRDTDGTDVQLYGGTARYDTTHGWFLVENDTHAALGVRDPTCDRHSGLLTVFLDRPASRVVSSWADTDETLSLYGYTVGASVGTDRVFLRFTRAGAMVPCQSVGLALRNGNVWFGGIMLPTE